MEHNEERLTTPEELLPAPIPMLIGDDTTPANVESLARELAAVKAELARVQIILQDVTESNRDYQQTTIENYNALWGILYPNEPDSWEYPGQIKRHLEMALKEGTVYRERDELRAELARVQDLLALTYAERDNARDDAAGLRALLEAKETARDHEYQCLNCGAFSSTPVCGPCMSMVHPEEEAAREMEEAEITYRAKLAELDSVDPLECCCCGFPLDEVDALYECHGDLWCMACAEDVLSEEE